MLFAVAMLSLPVCCAQFFCACFFCARFFVYVSTGEKKLDTYLGYLPGEVYGCLPFFFFLAVVYLVVGVVWMIMCMTYIKARKGNE